MAAPVGVRACALDAAVHAWDIAVVTGQPSPLSPELATTILDVAVQIVEPLRQYGAYAPAIDVGHDADPSPPSSSTSVGVPTGRPDLRRQPGGALRSA